MTYLDHTDELIKLLTPGTRVVHWDKGPGTITEAPVDAFQVPMRADSDGLTVYVYPDSLEFSGDPRG